MNEDQICGTIRTVPPGPWIKELAKRKIYLTDTWSDNPDIDILIGSELWANLMTGKSFKINQDLMAVESVFGWTLCCKLPEVNQCNLATSVISMHCWEDQSLSDLWNLDVIGIRDPIEKITQEEHDIRVKEEFQNKITREPDGRYVVSLPWIDKQIPLPINRNVAKKRLDAATNKLDQIGRYEVYNQIFQDWEEKGIIEKIKVIQEKTGHYLPHRAVLKPESLTTPVRPVFDASCKVGRSPSLNQCLKKGPNLLELFPTILLNFRTKKIGVVSDIRKAFQMVGVAPQDRDYQKFLWWANKSRKEICEYQHCRVVFGINCSPFILTAVLENHLNQVNVDDKKSAELLKRSLYVDNCVVSFDSKEEYQHFKLRSTEIMSQARMDLRQWEATRKGKDEDSATLVLGMKWDKTRDELFCQLPKNLANPEDFVVTKRTVLSLVSQVFDPLGVLCPALLQPKLMLQDSWATDLNWDTEWGQAEAEKLLSWCNCWK